MSERSNVKNSIVLVVLCKGCEYLENPENGQVTQTDNRICGDYAHFACKTGYQLVGANSLMCLWGQWQGTIPRCLPVGGKNVQMLHRNYAKSEANLTKFHVLCGV